MSLLLLGYCCSVTAVLCGPPPLVDNAFLIGRKRSHYDIHSVVRYQCADGFLQRHIPTTKCRASGKWDHPKILCTKCKWLCGIKYLYVYIWTKYMNIIWPFKDHYRSAPAVRAGFSVLICFPFPFPSFNSPEIPSLQAPSSQVSSRAQKAQETWLRWSSGQTRGPWPFLTKNKTHASMSQWSSPCSCTV